jgi:hypothetical protein
MHSLTPHELAKVKLRGRLGFSAPASTAAVPCYRWCGRPDKLTRCSGSQFPGRISSYVLPRYTPVPAVWPVEGTDVWFIVSRLFGYFSSQAVKASAKARSPDGPFSIARMARQPFLYTIGM